MNNFNRLIINWYRRNKRDLPWRETKNPYFIWLSEVILQQTKVNQGLKYYEKFTTNYPTVQDLANASEQSILNDWQGLGYYSRARNLHASAKQIMNEFDGIFPSSYNEIKKLKGVGEYTASAIASFAFDLPHSVLDGNVYRVLARYFDVSTPIDSTEGQKSFMYLANEMRPETDVNTYNQAIMEFGALQCTPVNPDCSICPLSSTCLAKINDTIKERPIKKNKIKITNRYFHYLHFQDSKSTVLEKRTEKDIWLNMYQFPLIEKQKEIEPIQIIKEIQQSHFIKNISIKHKEKHILSHQHINTMFYLINEIPASILNNPNYIVIDKSELSNYPIPRLIDRYLEKE